MLVPFILHRKPPLLSHTCAVVYTRESSRCAAQQCANMKRHIRVIGALPARIAQHNQCLSVSVLYGSSYPKRY